MGEGDQKVESIWACNVVSPLTWLNDTVVYT